MATATSFFARTRIIAPKEFNRWLIPPAALAIHLSIGQVYAFSVFKAPLMEFFAVREVAVGWIFSLAIGMLGLSSAVAGNWVEKVGPRTSMATAGLFGLWRNRWYRIGDWLYFPSINLDEMVSR